MERQLRAVVRGYVQGVGYRVFAFRAARRLGVTGWVKNRPDGAVEVVAEGDEPTLRELVSELERGPSEAEVSHVDTAWGAAENTFAEFEIRG